jgi:DNA-binding NtrC family response regulator
MPTVLVVDDESDIRELVRRYLESAGNAVLTSGTGSEALRTICPVSSIDFGGVRQIRAWQDPGSVWPLSGG